MTRIMYNIKKRDILYCFIS